MFVVLQPFFNCSRNLWPSSHIQLLQFVTLVVINPRRLCGILHDPLLLFKKA
jgi:hypothetical protein